jgi:hypothetical protein
MREGRDGIKPIAKRDFKGANMNVSENTAGSGEDRGRFSVARIVGAKKRAERRTRYSIVVAGSFPLV